MKEAVQELTQFSSPAFPRRSLQDELGSGVVDEERKGLLPQAADGFDDDTSEPPRIPSTRKRLALLCTAGFLIALLLGFLFRRPLGCLIRPSPLPVAFDRNTIQNNGTHDFKRTALIVSIDGLRADYLDRGLTPHLLNISKKGLRAKSMKPIFPTLTFPNHWALMTGLYAESHGIVANNFWDPHSGLEFHYNSIESACKTLWWQGEPMWETAHRAGIITANLMWPGPPKTASGVAPDYYEGWRDKVPLQEKLDQIMAWIDLPFEKRPQLIMAYEPSLDQAGHYAGPNSSMVNKVLGEVDVFARDLQFLIATRNLTDIVDIIFVSDHGMTDTSHPELVYMDDILGEGFEMIEHEDGTPLMGLRFRPEADQEKYLNILVDAASAGKFDVYTHDTMPERYHYANNYRIAPIYVVPKIGYELTNRVQNGAGWNNGTHGYDNDEPAMHAMFVAHGPFSSVVKAVAQSRIQARGLARPNQGWHSTADDVYVMDTFENVNIYNLMMKLLGIEDFAVSTNGTKGFWDKYF